MKVCSKQSVFMDLQKTFSHMTTTPRFLTQVDEKVSC